MKTIIFLLTISLCALLAACTFSRRPIPRTIAWDSLNVELKSYLVSHVETPEQYVVDKFKNHDVVFLGEDHYIAHDPQLVQALIPVLHQNGVNALGIEFIRRVDQPMVDSLMSLSAYSESLARDIFLRQYVWWGFQDYVDILKSAWKVNHSLKPKEAKFRIYGINGAPDWSYVNTPKDRDDASIMKKVWHGEDETDWAKIILDSAVAKGQKILVYCGIHHAFTRYRQPRADNGMFYGWGDMRAGNAVFQRIGARAMTIFLHAPWFSAKGYEQPPVLAADGYIDSLMREMPETYHRVGFDIAGTPFGNLSGETSIYKFGYDVFSLADFCDGYIYQGGVSSFQPVTVISDFVNEKNLSYARVQSGDIEARSADPDYFYKGMLKAADVKSRYSHLH